MKRQAGRHLAARAPTPRAQPRLGLQRVLARTNFRPDPAVRARVYARSVAVARRAGATARNLDRYRQILMSGKLRNEVSGILARYGMSPNNLVDATALYLAAAWLAVHGDNGAPTAAQMRGLRAQLAAAMTASPAILAASDTGKQELAEANIVQASLASSAVDSAEKNPAAAGRVRASVAGWVRDSYQIDLTRMTLTPQGLR